MNRAFLFKTQQSEGFIAFDIHGKYVYQERDEDHVRKVLAERGYTEIHGEDHNVILKGKYVSPRSDNYSLKAGEIYDIMLVPGIFDGSPYWIIPVDGKDPGSGGFHTYRFEVQECST